MPAPLPPAQASALIPAPKLENDFYDWHARHEAKARLASGKKHDLVFIGDSITHLFEGDANLPGRGEPVWAERFAPRGALNLGFGWDRTQNVLWRIDHGEFAGQTPRLIVLLIGTNNLTGTGNAPTNTPEQIVDGIVAIHHRLRVASPGSRVLQLGVLPRGGAADPMRGQIKRINGMLSDYAAARGPLVRYMDLGPLFLSGDGSIPLSLMNDGVHPTRAGYELWADAIEPTVREALVG